MNAEPYFQSKVTFDLSGIGPFGANNPLQSASFNAGPLLTSGTAYWLIGSGAGDGNFAWDLNNIGDLGLLYWTYEPPPVNGPTTRGAFRVSVTDVPVPPQLLGTLLTMGIAAWKLRPLRANSSDRSNSSKDIPIP